VQILLSGEERIDVWHPQDSPLIDNRLASDDLGFFDQLPDPSSLILRPGMFVFIPPTCPHQPLIQVHEPVNLRKVVIKIHRDLLLPNAKHVGSTCIQETPPLHYETK
jgi:YhcH/YjgK/YiaL family protein